MARLEGTCKYRMPAGEHCGGRGAPLCRSHITRSHNALLRLATFGDDSYAAEHAIALASSTTPPLSGSKNPPMVVDEALADHRIAVRGILAAWALNVADERSISRTTLVTGVRPLVGPVCAVCDHVTCRRIVLSHRPPACELEAVCAAFLRRHHEWTCGRTWAPDYARELLETADKAWRLLHPSRSRTIRDIGPCEEVLTAEFAYGTVETPCAGNLYAIVRDLDELLPSSIKCDACGVEVGSDKWVKFGARVLANLNAAAAA